MNTPQCYLCGSRHLKTRIVTLRDLSPPKCDDIKVLECENCGLVFLSSFDHIDQKFHEQSGMFKERGLNEVDMVFKFNIVDNDRRYKQFEEFIFNKDILDFGCGAGNFLVKARERAETVCGIEIDRQFDTYHRNLNLKVYRDISDTTKKFDVIFMFLVLPFIRDPLNLILTLKNKLNTNGSLIIETPNIDDALLTVYENESFSNFTYTSMSLFYYNERTLGDLLKKAGFKVNYIKNFQRYNLSNHLYWLCKQKPGGHQVWGFIDNEELNMAYAGSLAKIGRCDTLLGSFGRYDI